MLRSFESFRTLCQALGSTVLYTGTYAKPFKVEVEDGIIFFIPQSSKKRRRADSIKTARVLALLAESGDWSPKRYQTVTYHASYILAVAKSAGA